MNNAQFSKLDPFNPKCTYVDKKARGVRNLNSDVVNVSADIEDVEAK